jgi:hypothetical protein
MKVDPSQLKDRVRGAIQSSAIRGRIGDIVLEADRDDDGTDFLRVILEVRALEEVEDADIEALVESIEKAIGDVDERFPSVRFADAA